VIQVGRRSLRGSPILVVADARGMRYHIPNPDISPTFGDPMERSH
jgi:hypothetical protein